jgi:hypothetical protein
MSYGSMYSGLFALILLLIYMEYLLWTEMSWQAALIINAVLIVVGILVVLWIRYLDRSAACQLSGGDYSFFRGCRRRHPLL